jgi:hypothetical protein
MATKTSKTAAKITKEPHLEKINECLREWHDATSAKLISILDVASTMLRQLEEEPDSPVHQLIDKQDLEDLVHTLGEADCCMINLRAQPLLDDSDIPNTINCKSLRKVGA